MAKVLMKGNEAVGKAAIEAGCRFFFGYPITPQSEVPEYLSSELPKVGGTFVQAESEVAAINMVYGAACARTDKFLLPWYCSETGRYRLYLQRWFARSYHQHDARRPGPWHNPAWSG